MGGAGRAWHGGPRSGRRWRQHALFFAGRGHKVTAVDRDMSRLPYHPDIEKLQDEVLQVAEERKLETVRGKFSVVAYEARLVSEPHMAMVQRIAARRL